MIIITLLRIKMQLHSSMQSVPFPIFSGLNLPHLRIDDLFSYSLISSANGCYAGDILHVSLPPAPASFSTCLKKR